MTHSWQAFFPNFDQPSYFAGVTSAFAEVVGAGVKRLALSHPYSAEQLAQMREPTRQIAAHYGVLTLVEDDLIVTPLFPADVANGKFVILLAQDQSVLDAYAALKTRVAQATNRTDKEAAARNFGRLLSYDDATIERLINATQP